jgi:hypothetical protein
MNAEERDRLVASIVNRVADYRQGEIASVDAAHVLAWLHQFDQEEQSTLLRETDRILSHTYISRASVKQFISMLVHVDKLVGDSPETFWRDVGFLRIQRQSQSQREMLGLLDEVLRDKFQVTADREESTIGTYIFLDDVSFTGNQIKSDLLRWAEENDIRGATVHVIAAVLHSGGEYYAKQQLKEPFRVRGITYQFWAAHRFENRLTYRYNAEVLWPTHLPDEGYVNQWRATFSADQKYFEPRPPGGKGSTTLFSSEDAREIIEQAFLKKGAYIYSLPQNPDRNMRPLGYSKLRSPGFGSTVITYRNCPNNAPLVLWWGNPNGGAPLNRWHPLFQRRLRA